MQAKILYVTRNNGTDKFECPEEYTYIRGLIGKHGQLQVIYVTVNDDADIEKGKQSEVWCMAKVYAPPIWYSYKNGDLDLEN